MNINSIRELKYSRLKPEERFLIEIFDGLTVEESLKYKGILYMKDNYCYFYHNSKSNNFWYDYNRVYSVFLLRFNYNYQQTNDFVKAMVEEHFKLKGITTRKPRKCIRLPVEEHFKLKGITTKYTVGVSPDTGRRVP